MKNVAALSIPNLNNWADRVSSKNAHAAVLPEQLCNQLTDLFAVPVGCEATQDELTVRYRGRTGLQDYERASQAFVAAVAAGDAHEQAKQAYTMQCAGTELLHSVSSIVTKTDFGTKHIIAASIAPIVMEKLERALSAEAITR